MITLEKKPVRTETDHVKVGRFEATVIKNFYDGEEERKAQVEALTFLKSLIGKEKKVE
ncbi:MAG: hypothetical protein K0R06_276 [Clostridium sp.]|nr:hypothetical protein [Clostridium sp.]